MPLPAPSMPAAQPRDYVRYFFMAAVTIAFITRLPGLFMSLWYDELYTLLHFINAPWSAIVAGEYSPNNHVLFTLIARVFAALGDGPLTPLLTRLPSVLAGVGVALLLARPLQRSHPRAGVLLILLVAMHPWAVVISDWVRGYSLLLLLAVGATHLLMQRRIGWQYASLLAAALYTLPLAVLVLPAHAAALLLPSHRDLRKSWMRYAALALVTAGLLYAPFLAGARGYWSSAGTASLPYGQFVAASLRHACAGQNLQHPLCLSIAVVVCGVGPLLGWRRWPALRPAILTWGVASALGLLLPLAFPRAGEVRAMVWLIPLFCLGAAGLIETAWQWPRGQAAGLLLCLLGLGAMFRLDLVLWEIPAQPIGNAIQRARMLAGERGAVVGVYMAAEEARHTYGGLNAVIMNERQLARIEQLASRPLYACVFYGDYLQRDEPQLWARLQRDYEHVERLAGIIAPVDVYRRR